MPGISKVAIAESVDELKEQINKQYQARERERLQALYLLKSGKCQQIIEIAEILGRSRLTKPIVASLTGWDSILDALCVSGIF